MLMKANGSVSIGTEVNTAPLTVANFSTAFPTPQTGTLLHVVSDAVTNGRFSFDTYNNTTVAGSIMQGRRARGTASNPTAAIADDVLIAIGGDGYGDNAFHNVSMGGLALRSLGTMTNTDAPTYLTFSTVPSGSITQAERVRIKSDGTFQITALNSAGFLQTDVNGNFSTSALSLGNITTALGFTPLNAANNFSDIGNAGTARTNLGVAIGTNVQAFDADLSTIAGLTATTDNFIVSVASAWASRTPAQVKTTLSLDNVTNESKATMFTSPAFTGTPTGITASHVGLGSVSNNAQLTIANNLSDLNSAATARTNLGGTTVGINLFSLTNPSALGYLRINADNTVTHRTVSNVKTDLSLDNITNESKATMFTSPTFTGTTSGITATMVSLGNVTNESKATMFTSPTFTGTPLSTTASTGTNNTQVATTAYVVAASNYGTYRTILEASGSHIATKVAGTYGMGIGDPLAVSGTGTLYPLQVINIVAADYPSVNGAASKLRIRAQLFTNDVAPTGNYTLGLYPITRPGTSGGAGLNIYTIGTVVAGSNGATFTTPAADGLLSAVGSDFALPADGFYIIAVVTTGTVATSSLVHINAQLQIRNN